MVDNLNDGTEAARVGVLAVDDDNTANLYEAPAGSLNQCFAHCVGGSIVAVLVGNAVLIKSWKGEGRCSYQSRRCSFVLGVDVFWSFYHQRGANDFLSARLWSGVVWAEKPCPKPKSSDFLFRHTPAPRRQDFCARTTSYSPFVRENFPADFLEPPKALLCTKLAGS